MEPGLVAFYDIQPGNVAGLFLQPRSPYGAATHYIIVSYY